MRELNDNELKNINGGLSLSDISGSLISSITSSMKTILEIGRSLGSALRRGNSGKLCSIN